MEKTMIQLDHINKSFNKFHVVKDISLDIPEGEIFGIIGASGSGKTTLLNMTIGFLHPTSGDIKFRSPKILPYEHGTKEPDPMRSVFKADKDVKQTFGFAAQEPSFYKQLTLTENLDLFGTLYGLSQDAKETNALILLKMLGLYDYRNKLAETLSGGMQKRLDIACALIHDPAILILDEPTADLDPHLRQQMWSILKKINSKGTTIVLSSHFLDELEDICDRIGILYDGQLRHVGTPAELKRLISPNEEIHIETLKGNYDKFIEALKPHKKNHIFETENKGTELVIQTDNSHIVIEKMLHLLAKHNDVLIDLHLRRPSLNEVFETIIIKEEAHKRKGVHH